MAGETSERPITKLGRLVLTVSKLRFHCRVNKSLVEGPLSGDFIVAALHCQRSSAVYMNSVGPRKALHHKLEKKWSS
ncbi:hypothetical protein CCACVL1_19583 [Corchorus capsularis]|uniref:Uncharacterized protein n=1 Tax=Corchorus capsularis TaxID=210143 RepID=A0A1R3HG20_COCAP|nr:hypothetical protein CCACVL1_19583 [Corchorus capsularis]